ncbi:MAG: hypothetical protein FJ403_17820 [Verrucomicrobia bacterium]|nr:hypothetical protein [Verrucomicrobiota bacterium]
MSALEVIEQIKALPPEEQAVVKDFVREMETKASSSSDVRYMDDATFAVAKEQVFSKHAELLSRLAK